MSSTVYPSIPWVSHVFASFEMWSDRLIIPDVVREINMCALQYRDNLCASRAIPAMAEQCAEWKTCMDMYLLEIMCRS